MANFFFCLFSVAKLLLDKGANVSAESDTLSTPLHVAAELGNYKMVELLIRYRAIVNVQDDLGQTPLHLAANNGSKKF